MTDRVGGNIRNASLRAGRFAGWILLALALVYLLSGIYAVSPNEIGVQQRFGRVVDAAVPPGIHYRLPWPAERIDKVPVRMVSRISVDDFFHGQTLFNQLTGLASYCLTGDNNLVNIECTIQYTIARPADYLFRVADIQNALRGMTCNAILHSLAQLPVDEILTHGKSQIEQFIKESLQRDLDTIQSGLHISFVELKNVKPPERIQRYFDDVINAKIDKNKLINQAETYRNQKIPAAKADAARLSQGAEAYRNEVIAQAEGEAVRFLRRLEEYQKAQGVTRRRLYLESMSQILGNVGRRVVVDADSDGTAATLEFLSTP